MTYPYRKEWLKEAQRGTYNGSYEDFLAEHFAAYQSKMRRFELPAMEQKMWLDRVELANDSL